MYHTLILIGNLGRDPEMRYTPTGQPVVTLSLAANRRYQNPAGSTVKETAWFRITVWGRQAESCNQYLKKGSRILVEGRLSPDPVTGGPRTWLKDGKAGASYEVTASTVRFLSARDDPDDPDPAPEKDGAAPEAMETVLDEANVPF